MTDPITTDLSAWLELYWPSLRMQYPVGFERAFVGVVERAGREPVGCFDSEFCKTILEESGLTRAEADDFFTGQILSRDLGERTPMFITIKQPVFQN